MPKTKTAKEKRKEERRQERKKEKAQRKELSRLSKENPDEYDRLMEIQQKEYEAAQFRNLEERKLQINRLRKKLLGVGIEKYVSGYKRFNEIAEKFIETGEDHEENIEIEEMQSRGATVALVVSLNIDKSKDCSITVKNLKVAQSALEHLKERP